MPQPRATDTDLSNLTDLIGRRDDLAHLRVKKRGDSLTLYSEYNGESVPHVKLRKLGQSIWALSLADHRGRWERTPFSGTKQELLDLIANQFPWTIAPIA